MARGPSHRVEQVLTFGVEEEFVLVDSISRITVPRCPEVQGLAASRLGDRVAHELYSTQIEVHTRPAVRAGELREDLVQGRRVLAEAAARAGCELVASGSAVLTTRPLPVTDDSRYQRMTRRYAASVAKIDSESSGCHVHLGALDRGEAVVLSGYLRPWLPVLQALATNSPFAAGVARHCASWRYYQQKFWPTVGPAPVVTADGYETLAQDLVGSGALLDRKMIYWYARPSEHLPTLEVRVPDVNADVDVDLLIAVLTRALATILLAELRSGVPCPQARDAEVREAHRQAALHGLAGAWTHPVTGMTMPLSAGLRQLVERSAPVLGLLDEERLTQRLLRQIAARGTGDQRQRAVFRRRGLLTDVVDDLAARTVRV